MFGNVLPWDKSGGRVNSEVKQRLRKVLMNDQVLVLSSLEMNQFATMTYHEGQHTAEDDLCETIFGTLREILSMPASYSVPTLQKSLAITRHLLACGADRVLNESRVLAPPIEQLQNYNTALAAQQQVWYKIMGGAVDQGGPIREAAAGIVRLWTVPEALALERAKHSDAGSLVPVGSAQQMGFVTEEARRFQLLQARVKHEQQKSNLVKADNGFGGGYASRDGKAVVGAAHSLEEMQKKAQQAELAFSDESVSRGSGLMPAAPIDVFSEYTAPSAAELIAQQQGYAAARAAPVAPPTPTVDLLDLGAPVSTKPAISSSSAANDLLNMSLPMQSSPPMNPMQSSVPSTFGMQSMDPFASVSTQTAQPTPPVPPSHVQKQVDYPPPAAAPVANSMLSMTSDPFAGLGGDSLASPMTNLQPNSGVTTNATSIHVASTVRAAPTVTDEYDNPWVMGGSAGSGFQPIGQAPATAPPPPPSH